MTLHIQFMTIGNSDRYIRFQPTTYLYISVAFADLRALYYSSNIQQTCLSTRLSVNRPSLVFRMITAHSVAARVKTPSFPSPANLAVVQYSCSTPMENGKPQTRVSIIVAEHKKRRACLEVSAAGSCCILGSDCGITGGG